VVGMDEGGPRMGCCVVGSVALMGGLRYQMGRIFILTDPLIAPAKITAGSAFPLQATAGPALGRPMSTRSDQKPCPASTIHQCDAGSTRDAELRTVKD
jgi:hypothetical protein